jgi:small subunit ribosomal protein S7
MSRRRRAEKRFVPADLRHDSEMVARLINFVMRRGKKSVAERIVYQALDRIAEKNPDKSPVEVLNQAMENVKPRLEVKSRRVGGANYQVPVEVAPDRQVALALRWMIGFAQSRRGPMSEALASEILDAAQNTGNAVKKRDDTHKMAQANRAFAHYRW